MTTLNTIIEEETTPDTEGNLIEHNGNYYVRCEAHEEVVRRLQEKHEEAITSRDTYWKERVRKAVNDGYKLAVKHLEEAYQANATTTVPEIIEWLRDNARLSHQIDND